MPQYLLERAQRAGFNANTKFTPEVQDAITLNELRSSHGINEFLSGKISEEQFLQKLAPTWRGLPQGKINAAKLGGTADLTYQDQYSGRNLAGKTYATTISELRNIRSGGNKPVASTQQRNKPAVVAAPAQQQMQQQSAQQVAQVPVTQSQPQVNILPLQGGGGNQQGTAKPHNLTITFLVLPEGMISSAPISALTKELPDQAWITVLARAAFGGTVAPPVSDADNWMVRDNCSASCCCPII